MRETRTDQSRVEDELPEDFVRLLDQQAS
jgi:hypothetical protein